MFFILAAFVGETSFMLLSLLVKRMRNENTHATSVMAVYGLTSPIWMCLTLYFVVSGQVVWSVYYLMMLGAWLVINFFYNYGAIYLTRFQSLSEGAGYKFGVSLLLAWMVDLLFFEPLVGGEQFISIILCFVGGVWLSLNRDKTAQTDVSIPLWQRLAFISFLSGLEIIMFSTYKIGAQIQVSPLVQLSLAHAILIPVFFVVGYKNLRVDIKAGQIKSVYIGVVCALLIIGVFAETYAIYGLPITFLVLFYLIRSTVFAIHDMVTKELKVSLMNVSAVFMILGGIFYMSYLNI